MPSTPRYRSVMVPQLVRPPPGGSLHTTTEHGLLERQRRASPITSSTTETRLRVGMTPPATRFPRYGHRIHWQRTHRVGAGPAGRGRWALRRDEQLARAADPRRLGGVARPGGLRVDRRGGGR